MPEVSSARVIILAVALCCSFGGDCEIDEASRVPTTTPMSPEVPNEPDDLCFDQYLLEVNRLCQTFGCAGTAIDWCDEESAIPSGGYHRYTSHSRARVYRNGSLWDPGLPLGGGGLERCEECESTCTDCQGALECLRVWIDDFGRLLSENEAGNWVRASTRIGVGLTLGQTTWIPKALGSDATSLWYISDMIDRPPILPELSGYEIGRIYYVGSALREDSLIYLEGVDENGDHFEKIIEERKDYEGPVDPDLLPDVSCGGRCGGIDCADIPF